MAVIIGEVRSGGVSAAHLKVWHAPVRLPTWRITWSTLKSWYVLLMSSCPGLSAETCQHWDDGPVITLPVLEQLPVRRGSGVACALQIQGRQSEFKTSWSGPNVGGGHWRLFWGACWSAQAAWSSRIIVDKLIQTGQCCLGDLKWVERKMPSKRDGGSGEYEVEKWECCICNGWRNEKKLCIQIATHMIQIVKSCFTHLQNVIQTLKSP